MDDLQRFELECPSCKTALAEWAEQCPHCGLALMDVYSGRFRAGRKPWVRLVAGVILLAIFAGAAGTIALLFHG